METQNRKLANGSKLMKYVMMIVPGSRCLVPPQSNSITKTPFDKLRTGEKGENTKEEGEACLRGKILVFLYCGC
jgi:hypothetical protein